MTENPFSCGFVVKKCTVHERDINTAVSIKEKHFSTVLQLKHIPMESLSRKSASEQSIVKEVGKKEKTDLEVLCCCGITDTAFLAGCGNDLAFRLHKYKKTPFHATAIWLCKRRLLEAMIQRKTGIC